MLASDVHRVSAEPCARVTERPPRLISYQLSLLLAISLLVLASGALIIGNGYVRNRSVVTALASQLFREVSERTVLQTHERLARAIPAIELLRTRMRDGLLVTDSDALARELLEVIRANPEFTWVSYGDADGTFTGVYRTDGGALRINQ